MLIHLGLGDLRQDMLFCNPYRNDSDHCTPYNICNMMNTCIQSGNPDNDCNNLR